MDRSQELPGAEEAAELAARGQRTVTLLEAANTGTSTAAGLLQRAGCELACSSGGQQLWRDCLESPAVLLAGSRHFAAAALMDGTLQVCSWHRQAIRAHPCCCDRIIYQPLRCLCCTSCAITRRRQSRKREQRKSAGCRFDRGLSLQTAPRGVQDTASGGDASGMWVQVYTRGGRRMLPAMQLEGPAAFLANDTGWLLMAVASSGAMRVWDLQKQQLRLEGSVDALLHGTAGDARGGQTMWSEGLGAWIAGAGFKPVPLKRPWL